jgi:hypothetical protein
VRIQFPVLPTGRKTRFIATTNLRLFHYHKHDNLLPRFIATTNFKLFHYHKHDNFWLPLSITNMIFQFRNWLETILHYHDSFWSYTKLHVMIFNFKRHSSKTTQMELNSHCNSLATTFYYHLKCVNLSTTNILDSRLFLNANHVHLMTCFRFHIPIIDLKPH